MKKETSEEYTKLLEFAKDWTKTKFFPFTIDDLKADYIKQNKQPESCYLLPNIMKYLEFLNLIKWNDEKLVKSKAKGNKGRFVKEWISAAYSEKQSKKRLLEETAKSRELEKKQTNLDL